MRKAAVFILVFFMLLSLAACGGVVIGDRGEKGDTTTTGAQDVQGEKGDATTTGTQEAQSEIVQEDVEGDDMPSTCEKETDGLPSYWESHLDTKIAHIKEQMEQSSLHGDNFVFFTDYHIEGNAGHSHKLIERILDNTPINMVVFGGDAFNISDTKQGALNSLSMWFNRFKNVPMYSIRGNHEYNFKADGNGDAQISESNIYNYLIKKNEMKIKGVSGQLYYYMDNENQKIRYIFLDAKHDWLPDYIIDDAQLDWMKAIITELASDWTVVVFTHQLVNGQSVDEAYYNSSGKKIHNAIVDVKSSAKCTIAAIVSGHTHFDWSNDTDGFVEVATTCDTMFYDLMYTRTSGTVTEHAFDVFSIDTQNKVITAIRIGVGANRTWSYN